jgi:hypothetical protein
MNIGTAEYSVADSPRYSPVTPWSVNTRMIRAVVRRLEPLRYMGMLMVFSRPMSCRVYSNSVTSTFVMIGGFLDIIASRRSVDGGRGKDTAVRRP